MEIKLIINKDSIAKSERGVITGEIFFLVDDQYFPGIKWDDFIVTISLWWLQAISESKSNAIELRFMDGPYLIRGIVSDNDRISLSFIRYGFKKEYIEIVCDYSFKDFKKAILHMVQLLIEICEEKNWNTDEVNSLQESYKKILNSN